MIPTASDYAAASDCPVCREHRDMAAISAQRIADLEVENTQLAENREVLRREAREAVDELHAKVAELTRERDKLQSQLHRVAKDAEFWERQATQTDEVKP